MVRGRLDILAVPSFPPGHRSKKPSSWALSRFCKQLCKSRMLFICPICGLLYRPLLPAAGGHQHHRPDLIPWYPKRCESTHTPASPCLRWGHRQRQRGGGVFLFCQRLHPGTPLIRSGLVTAEECGDGNPIELTLGFMFAMLTRYCQGGKT